MVWAGIKDNGRPHAAGSSAATQGSPSSRPSVMTIGSPPYLPKHFGIDFTSPGASDVNAPSSTAHTPSVPAPTLTTKGASPSSTRRTSFTFVGPQRASSAATHSRHSSLSSFFEGLRRPFTSSKSKDTVAPEHGRASTFTAPMGEETVAPERGRGSPFPFPVSTGTAGMIAPAVASEGAVGYIPTQSQSQSQSHGSFPTAPGSSAAHARLRAVSATKHRKPEDVDVVQQNPQVTSKGAEELRRNAPSRAGDEDLGLHMDLEEPAGTPSIPSAAKGKGRALQGHLPAESPAPMVGAAGAPVVQAPVGVEASTLSGSGNPIINPFDFHPTEDAQDSSPQESAVPSADDPLSAWNDDPTDGNVIPQQGLQKTSSDAKESTGTNVPPGAGDDDQVVQKDLEPREPDVKVPASESVSAPSAAGGEGHGPQHDLPARSAHEEGEAEAPANQAAIEVDAVRGLELGSGPDDSSGTLQLGSNPPHLAPAELGSAPQYRYTVDQLVDVLKHEFQANRYYIEALFEERRKEQEHREKSDKRFPALEEKFDQLQKMITDR